MRAGAKREKVTNFHAKENGGGIQSHAFFVLKKVKTRMPLETVRLLLKFNETADDLHGHLIPPF